MNIELHDQQIDIIEKLHNGAILHADVGTGKSRTAIAYYYFKVCQGGAKINGSGSYHKMKRPKDLYIITTARKRDTEEWGGEYASLGLIKAPQTNVDGVSVVVDSWNNITRYIGIKDAFFIFDEQRLVGKGTWSKAFLKIAKQNEWILLTGTPGDTWMDYATVFIANGFYRTRSEFEDRHVVYDRFSKFPKVKAYRGTAALKANQARILVRMEYKKQTTRHKHIVNVSYDKLLYESVIKDRWNPYKNEPIKQIANLGYVLRRVLNSNSSRLEAVIDILKTRKRAIIFYSFTYELETLRMLADIPGMKVAEWNGEKHEPLPDGDNWVYLVQYTAGAEGWNCTTTDTIIFYSLNYSYKTVTQAEGRIDRFNTPYRHLHYYYLKSDSDMDRKIDRALSSKKKFNERTYFAKLLGE